LGLLRAPSLLPQCFLYYPLATVLVNFGATARVTLFPPPLVFLLDAQRTILPSPHWLRPFEGNDLHQTVSSGQVASQSSDPSFFLSSSKRSFVSFFFFFFLKASMRVYPHYIPGSPGARGPLYWSFCSFLARYQETPCIDSALSPSCPMFSVFCYSFLVARTVPHCPLPEGTSSSLSEDQLTPLICPWDPPPRNFPRNFNVPSSFLSGI